MKSLLQKLVRGEEGQDLIEYAFLSAFIALFVLAMVQAVGTQLNVTWTNINAALAS